MAEPFDGKSILIVDDDADMVTAIEAALKDSGATLKKAGDGNAAVTIAQADNPDLVILDLMLPKRSGLLVLVVFMASVYNISMLWQAVAVAVTAGAVMSSRIYLGDHTSSEVWAGLSAGAVIMGISLFILLR